MRKLIYLAVGVIALAGCATKQIVQPAKIITNTVEKVVTKNTRDTTFIVEADSSFYKAWIECRDGKPILKNPTATKGNGNLNAPQVKLNELGELIAECSTENLELKARINELTTEIANTSATVEYVPVEVVKELTFYQKLLINLGKVFGSILIGLIGYAAFKLVKKYYVK